MISARWSAANRSTVDAAMLVENRVDLGLRGEILEDGNKGKRSNRPKRETGVLVANLFFRMTVSSERRGR